MHRARISNPVFVAFMAMAFSLPAFPSGPAAVTRDMDADGLIDQIELLLPYGSEPASASSLCLTIQADTIVTDSILSSRPDSVNTLFSIFLTPPSTVQSSWRSDSRPQLSWTAQVGGQSYSVRCTDGAGPVLWLARKSCTDACLLELRYSEPVRWAPACPLDCAIELDSLLVVFEEHPSALQLLPAELHWGSASPHSATDTSIVLLLSADSGISSATFIRQRPTSDGPWDLAGNPVPPDHQPVRVQTLTETLTPSPRQTDSSNTGGCGNGVALSLVIPVGLGFGRIRGRLKPNARSKA